MNRKLMDWLACPTCSTSELSLQEDRPGEEVDEGELACGACGQIYEIRQGIPFLLPPELRARVEERTGRVAPASFDEYRTEATPAVARLLGRLARRAQVVLDIGSGRCPYLHLFSGDLVCLDLYPQFLSELQDRSSANLRVHAVCASATHLPFRRDFADLVFASEVIEHLDPEDADRALADWPQRARKWCVIDTPNGDESALITRLRHLIYRTESLTEVEHPELPELDHHSTFSPDTFRQAGYDCHGCIGWVSRKRFRLGPLWDVYDAVAWRLPAIGGTLVAVRSSSDCPHR
jgi:uncharacterized protein YbaR (Trm112 family)